MATSPLSHEELAVVLSRKAKHYLINQMGTTCEGATPHELYRAMSYALREEIMIDWLATWRTIERDRSRILYYLSMEFLPGRLGVNCAINLGERPLVNKILERLGRKERDLLHIEPDPALGNGGLGRLASCLLDSLATLRYPAMGYGLRYQYGLFEQELWRGKQIERPDCWLLQENPWEFRRDNRSQMVRFAGLLAQKSGSTRDLDFELTNCEEVRALAYDIPIVGFTDQEAFNVNTLRLWSTKESPRNFFLQKFNAGQLGSAAENTTLTDVLYPNDQHEMGQRIRLKQEFLLVSASLQDIMDRFGRTHGGKFDQFADKACIQINDTHPSLAIAELTCQLLDRGLSWKQAVENTLHTVSYTNHTILREALEQWNQCRMAELLPRQYHVIEKLNLELCEQVRARYPGDEERVRRMSILEDSQVRMANLAIFGSHHINGVAALHTEILKTSVFNDFYQLFPDRFVNITNGVTHRRWILGCNPPLAELLDDTVGTEWHTDFAVIENLRQFADLPDVQRRFLEIKRAGKEQLIAKLPQIAATRDAMGHALPMGPLPTSAALFDVQIKRFHEYKRQLLNALHLIISFQRALAGQMPPIERVVIFSGKAAAGYEMAKNTISLICAIAAKVAATPGICEHLKIYFVENYNVSRADLLVPAADLSQQISTAGMEASGTGNMKLAMNGALTIGTEDGANIEMRERVGDVHWPFRFGATEDQLKQLRQEGYSPGKVAANHPPIAAAIEALRDRTFARDEEEHRAFSAIYDALLSGQGGQPADRYFVVYDLPDYIRAQQSVEQQYLDSSRWARLALNNIAGMGYFTTDRSIKNYAEKIWKLAPIEVDATLWQQCRRDHEIT